MGQNNCMVTGNWLDDSSYQAILRETHMIAFEFDTTLRIQKVSPFIGEYIAGNYDGRLLSDVMLEDDVIHPDDIAKSLAFREKVIQGRLGELILRLRTPRGKYRWFRVVMTCQKNNPSHHMYVGVLEDVDMCMQYQELLRRRVETDPVSGIYNRETFFRRTQRLLDIESGIPHFLLCFDIDRFKMVNKLFGNAEGDKVLSYVGVILREEALKEDTYGRIGSDMFAICTARNQADTISLVNEIERRMRRYPLAFRFFLPTGIVPLTLDCRDPVNQLCDRAVMAQHKIKGSYIRSCSFYEPAMDTELEREHRLITNMENAMERGQFSAYFQPKYDMRDGRIIGAEALARWEHPALGMVSPAEFIPLFERNGFIIKLDEYIWELVCRTLRRWLDKGITPIPVSVNVSRMHLYNEHFCGYIMDLCRRYEVPHHLLELEITESAYTECPQELFPVMDILQQAGFSFSMDDFGSGYSSLNILKDIPVNLVKFDLRFLGEARKGKGAGQSILKNMIRLMNDLKVTILAEGVETEEQVLFLENAGCHLAQGYYYAPPMPVNEFERLLEPGIIMDLGEEE